MKNQIYVYLIQREIVENHWFEIEKLAKVQGKMFKDEAQIRRVGVQGAHGDDEAESSLEQAWDGVDFNVRTEKQWLSSNILY